jgi:hypothetical protein
MAVMPVGMESCRNPAVLLKTSTWKSAACAGTAVKPMAAATRATQKKILRNIMVISLPVVRMQTGVRRSRRRRRVMEAQQLRG